MSRKSIQVPKSAYNPADLTYFTLRSVVSAASVDSRAPDKVLCLEFSLRLPETLSSSLGSTSTTDSNLFLGMAPSKAEEDIGFRLGWLFSVNYFSDRGRLNEATLAISFHYKYPLPCHHKFRYFSRLPYLQLPNPLTGQDLFLPNF